MSIDEKYPMLKPLEEFPRISVEELMVQLEEILDRIQAENIAYVITEEGRDAYVLCPVEWVSWKYGKRWEDCCNDVSPCDHEVVYSEVGYD